MRLTPSLVAGGIFGVIEIAYSIAYLLVRYQDQTELVQLALTLNLAAYFAFFLLSALSFQSFTYRSLRVVAAFLFFLIVPAVFSLAVTKFLVDINGTKLWFEMAFAVTAAIKLGIATGICVWTASRSARLAN